MQNLHSTMVLLKSTKSSCKEYFSPSTFHYGSIKIRYDLIVADLSSTSTFHYGSIKIDGNKAESVVFSSSTFHYGSIKMVSVHFYLRLYSFIYIPLWFY